MKISALPLLPAPTGDEVVPAIHGGRTYGAAVGGLVQPQVDRAAAYAAAAAAMARPFVDYASGAAASADGQPWSVLDPTGWVAIYVKGTSPDVAHPLIRLPGDAAYAGPGGAALIGWRHPAGSAVRGVADALAELPMSVRNIAALIPDGRDNTVGLQALVDAGAGGSVRIPRATWLVSGTIVVPAGTTVLIDDYALIKWTGAHLGSGATGIFDASAGGIRIAVHGRGHALFACDQAQPFLYAVAGRDSVDVELAGLSVQDLGAYFFTSSKGDTYADVVTPTMKSAGDARPLSICQRLTMRDCGSTFSVRQTAGQGQCYVAYAFGVKITDGWAVGGTHGLQLWGGNANPGVDGGLASERKLQDVVVTGFRADTLGGAGIFTSMGERVTISTSTAANCGDVGIDFEGCTDCKAALCTSRNAANGCYSTFFYSRQIQIIGCDGFSFNKLTPLYRNTNVEGDPNNRDIKIDGGTWTCSDTTGPATIDWGSGPMSQISIANVRLVNVVIYAAFRLINQVNLSNIEILLPFGFTGDVIVIDGLDLVGAMKPWARISGVKINGAGAFGASTNLIRITNRSFNAPASYVVEGVTGSVYRGAGNGDAGILLEDVNTNAMGASFAVRGCLFDGSITTRNSGVGIPSFPVASGDNRHLDGTQMPVVTA